MYWENKKNKDRPEYIDLCFETIKKHCSKDFKINVLNEKTIHNYLNNLRPDIQYKLSIPQKTDYYRYNLLYKYYNLLYKYWILLKVFMIKTIIFNLELSFPSQSKYKLSTLRFSKI